MNYTNEQIWGALSTRRKDQLLEANRDVNVQFDWWTSTYESFVEDCKAIGIEVDPERIHFSGFWSQGDGAAFDGRVADWDKVLTYIAREQWIDMAVDAGWMFASHCRNDNNMSYEECFDVPDNPYDAMDEPLQHHAWLVSGPDDSALDAISTALATYFIELAAELYSNLEAEHEYLTSDQSVSDWIVDFLSADELIGDEEEFILPNHAPKVTSPQMSLF